jgi:hypothetical protein
MSGSGSSSRIEERLVAVAKDEARTDGTLKFLMKTKIGKQRFKEEPNMSSAESLLSSKRQHSISQAQTDKKIGLAVLESLDMQDLDNEAYRWVRLMRRTRQK